MLPKVLALATTVVLLVFMGYFMLGSLPLLVLKHDTPTDARFIRGFFNVYYRAVLLAAIVSAVAYAFAGQPLFCAGMTALAIVVEAARRVVLSRMDYLRGVMTADDAAAIAKFRRIHIGGMVLNAAQLAALGFGITQLGL
jgi:hypothetical protein